MASAQAFTHRSEAAERQASEEMRAKRRKNARMRYRRMVEEEERREREGLPSLLRGTRARRSGPRHRRVRGLMVSDLSDLMRDWDQTLNWGTDPATLRCTSAMRAFWRCHHDEDHVWDARITDRAASMSRCPYCMGNRVHPKDSLAAYAPHLVAEWHPTKNGDLFPEQVAPVSGRKVWCRCAAGHEWEAYVFSRSQHLHGCKQCHDEARRKPKRPSRTKGTGAPKRKRRPNPVIPDLVVPDDELF